MHEPGHGTQVHTFANDPSDESCSNGRHINGVYWKCGHDYLDTELADVCELSYIIGKSDWYDNTPAEECPPRLIFTYDRRGDDLGEIEVDPLTPDFDDKRFIERYTGDPPLGAPDSPW